MATHPLKLTPAQVRVIQNLAVGRPGYFGLFGEAAMGGYHGTVRSLVRRGLVTPRTHVLTRAGRQEHSAHSARKS